MMYLRDLIESKGDKLILYNHGKMGRQCMTVFDYSVKYGGTFDSFRYYNDYYVEIAE